MSFVSGELFEFRSSNMEAGAPRAEREPRAGFEGQSHQ
jgi:hypothetical protein